MRAALEIRQMLDEGIARNQAEIARLRDLSRARVTQLVNIARLPQPVLDHILSLPTEQQASYTERRLRRIVSLASEEEQFRAFEELRRSVEARGGRDLLVSLPQVPVSPICGTSQSALPAPELSERT